MRLKKQSIFSIHDRRIYSRLTGSESGKVGGDECEGGEMRFAILKQVSVDALKILAILQHTLNTSFAF